MSIEVSLQDFDRWGNLNAAGEREFWSEFNQAIKKLDEGHITLKPRKFQNSKTMSIPTPKTQKDEKSVQQSPTPDHPKNNSSRNRSRSNSTTRAHPDDRVQVAGWDNKNTCSHRHCRRTPNMRDCLHQPTPTREILRRISHLDHRYRMHHHRLDRTRDRLREHRHTHRHN